jgi:membrane protease YdiL (CAAX protease family)
MSKTVSFWLEIFLLLILPVGLLMWSPAALALRPLLLAIGGAYCLWRLRSSHVSLADLGLSWKGFSTSLRSLALPSLLLVAFTYLLFMVLPLNSLRAFVRYDSLTMSSFSSRILAYILLSSPIQELIFRGYLTWRLNQVFTNNYLIKLISIGLFTIVHLPFYSPLLLFISTTMGVMYIWVYSRDRNLYAPIISHSIVGACMLVIRNAWFPY